MAQQNPPIKCANCLYPLDQPTVVVNGHPYCCSGCAQGGPCICSYGHPAANEKLMAGNPDLSPHALPGGAANSPLSTSFTRMVENMVKEVEITRQVIKQEAGPVNDLLALLQKATRLLQIMAYRLEGPPSSVSPSHQAIQPPAQASDNDQESWERISLVVENATEPDIAFSYTRALGKLDSVGDIKLVSINKTNLLYRVETKSKARFAREVMSLPNFRPVRIQATLDEISIRLDGHPDNSSDLEKLLVDTSLDETEHSTDTPGVPEERKPASRASRKGVMEAGIDGFFNARHYLVHEGEPGPVEMRSWRVEVSLEGDQFDENGMLSGFGQAQEAVGRLMAAYNNKLLNKLEPYDQIQPTPENIARTLYEQLKAAIADQPLRLKGLKVWASPTQYVWYSEPPGHAK